MSERKSLLTSISSALGEEFFSRVATTFKITGWEAKNQIMERGGGRGRRWERRRSKYIVFWIRKIKCEGQESARHISKLGMAAGSASEFIVCSLALKQQCIIGRPKNKERQKDASCSAFTHWDSGSWQWSRAQGGACEPPEYRPALSESARTDDKQLSMKCHDNHLDSDKPERIKGYRCCYVAVKMPCVDEPQPNNHLPHTECCRWWWRRCWCASSASPPAVWTDCVCAWSLPSSCRETQTACQS